MNSGVLISIRMGTVRRILKGVAAVALATLASACTVNIGTNSDSGEDQLDSPDQSLPTEDTATVSKELDAQSSWESLVESENALSAGEISVLPTGTFGLMAAPSIRLFKIETNTWVEETAKYIDAFDLPDSSIDFEISIQSVQITNDGAVDYVVNFRPAPWDLSEAPNQGRDHGTVISGQDGYWRSLAFWDPYGDGLEYTAVQHIEYLNGALLGDWFGSCGRPCGTLLYEWVGGASRLEGVDATPEQIEWVQQPTCANFNYTETLPLAVCTEGLGVSYTQGALLNFGFEIDMDGYFGPGTRLAVQLFQRQKGIRASGVVDIATWRSLFEGVLLPGNDLNGDGLITPNEMSGG